MSKVSRIGAMVFLLIIPLVLGCYRTPQAAPPTGENVINDVRGYFPAAPKLTWVYEGSGNEYAAFTNTVLYAEGNKAQFAQDNGGTVMALVYEISSEAVILVFAQEEAYTQTKFLVNQPNRRKILLKAPLRAGAAWESEQERREVVDTAASVQVPSGSYSNVVKIKITSLVPDATEYAYEFYAPGTGLVLRQFVFGNTKIQSQLKSYK